MSHAVPIPQGDYVGVVRHGDLLITAGITPRENGIMANPGRFAADTVPEAFRGAVELAARNVLAALEAALSENERIRAILASTIYLATDPGFTSHASVADFASAVFRDRLGTAGGCARATVGVATLPGGACAEISVIASVSPRLSTEAGIDRV